MDLTGLCLCGGEDESDSDGRGAVEEDANAVRVVEVDCRVFDDGTRTFRLERRAVVWYCGMVARDIGDAAVECACDEAALGVLEARMEMRSEMDSAGIEDLPMSFGTSRRPRKDGAKSKKAKARKKRKQRHGAAREGGAARGGWRVGDACECYYEGDGLWYVGVVTGYPEAHEDGLEVSLVGYDCVVSVPATWLKATERYAAPEASDAPEAAAVAAPAPGGGGDGDREAAQEGSSAAAGAAGTAVTQRLADAPNAFAGTVDDKYWAQRFHYFSLYDCGVRLDAESWYSVTPEKVAAAIARRVAAGCGAGGGVVVDAFCGCGGNAIALAGSCGHVVAIDIDATKLSHARHNAAIYGVADRVDFVLGDATKLLGGLRADAVFLSPPWGGPDYGDDFDVATIDVGGVDGLGLLALAKRAAPRVAYYLPRTTSAAAVAAAARHAGVAGPVTVASHFLNHKFKAKTAYFGFGAS